MEDVYSQCCWTRIWAHSGTLGKDNNGKKPKYLNWEEVDDLKMMYELAKCYDDRRMRMILLSSFENGLYSHLNATFPLWFLDIALHS